MRFIAKRFTYLLMDERAALAARLLATGASFWCAGGGSMVVARSAMLLTLSKREAGQIASLLSVKPTASVQRLERGALEPKLFSMLLADAGAEIHGDAGPMAAPSLCAQLPA
jgi:hypothetical protein